MSAALSPCITFEHFQKSCELRQTSMVLRPGVAFQVPMPCVCVSNYIACLC